MQSHVRSMLRQTVSYRHLCPDEYLALMIVCDTSTIQYHLGRGPVWPHAVGEKSKLRNVLIAFSWIILKIRRIATSWIAWLAAPDVVGLD